MSSDQIETYIIGGERIAARSKAAAIMSHRRRMMRQSESKLERDAKAARTQPYYDREKKV